jgi:hypothetical protein
MVGKWSSISFPTSFSLFIPQPSSICQTKGDQKSALIEENSFKILFRENIFTSIGYSFQSTIDVE